MLRHQLNNKFNVAVLVLFVAVTFLSGCNKKEPVAPAAPQPAQVIAQPAKPVQKAVSSAVKLQPPPAGNQFDFSSKKDPFKPFNIVKAITGPTLDEQKKSQTFGLPIHSFDVSQFKLIGIVTGVKDNQAMVVDPNGKGYVLKQGMTIGKNDGRITSITTSGVDVLEQFKDDNGRVRKEIIKITLPRKQ